MNGGNLGESRFCHLSSRDVGGFCDSVLRKHVLSTATLL